MNFWIRLDHTSNMRYPFNVHVRLHCELLTVQPLGMHLQSGTGEFTMSTYLARLGLGILCFFTVTSLLQVTQAEAFELRVIDWVQGRPGIPHPAVNGKPTMLQAIVEAPECSGSVKYRWDINADGDFNDGDEHWRDAGTNYGNTWCHCWYYQP